MEIKPALTKEEWERVAADEFTVTVGRATEIRMHVDGGIGVQSEDYEGGSCTKGDRHALAALALYGQPFGFTRDDVEDLLGRADREEEAASYSGARVTSRLRSLAARIGALLPSG